MERNIGLRRPSLFDGNYIAYFLTKYIFQVINYYMDLWAHAD